MQKCDYAVLTNIILKAAGKGVIAGDVVKLGYTKDQVQRCLRQLGSRLVSLKLGGVRSRIYLVDDNARSKFQQAVNQRMRQERLPAKTIFSLDAVVVMPDHVVVQKVGSVWGESFAQVQTAPVRPGATDFLSIPSRSFATC